MPRYVLVDNLSERPVADVVAADPLAAYRMAPDPLEAGEQPTFIRGGDIYRIWYGYRVYEVPADFPPVIAVGDGDPWEQWERLSEGMAVVACIGALDREDD